MAVYTTKSGDTWDVIAKQVYDDEYKADVLMEANPEKIDTFIFSAGECLTVPDLEEKDDGSLPPWKYGADL
jgi:nucleoid-associated protein YgaU